MKSAYTIFKGASITLLTFLLLFSIKDELFKINPAQAQTAGLWNLQRDTGDSNKLKFWYNSLSASLLTLTTDGNVTSAGYLRSANGTKTAVGYGFSSEGGDTGMYLYSDNNLSFSTGGADRLFIRGDGAIGVGTNNPNTGQKLQVAGNIRTDNGAANSVAYGFTSEGGDTGMYLVGDNTLGFSTAGGVRFMIDSGSRTFINTTSSPTYNETGMLNILQSNGRDGINLRNASGGNQTFNLWLSNGATVALSFNTGTTQTSVGSITLTSSSTSYNTSSDKRLKENIIPTTLGLETLMKIPVQDFNFKNDPQKERVQGFVAQDLYEFYPQAVHVGGKDPAKDPWSVDYGRITPLLLNSIKEQQKEIEDLKKEVEVLKGKIESCN